jgi:hypothetical protein
LQGDRAPGFGSLSARHVLIHVEESETLPEPLRF